ncbi:fimbrial protein [Scandinavium sp. H11S7]|uniref:Fimbrial protein n=1 Tax=Scandinavium hiltneri TaxID=2926519 RepID=A0ABT2E3N4_9ENTR|nr:fimbrial protein [Scandinavium hiltneri]MCS2162481.1 fimbrial protein [Scandinavium hiltneri]
MSIISIKWRYCLLIQLLALFSPFAYAATYGDPVKGPDINFYISLGIGNSACKFDSDRLSIPFGTLQLSDIINHAPQTKKNIQFIATECGSTANDIDMNIMSITLNTPLTTDYNGTPIIAPLQGQGYATGIGIGLYLLSDQNDTVGELMETNTNKSYEFDVTNAPNEPSKASIYLRAELLPLVNDKSTMTIGELSAQAWLTLSYK